MNENDSIFTPYDEMTQTRQLQIIKTVIPYLPSDKQRQLSFIIQYIQMINSLNIFSNNQSLIAQEVKDPASRRNAIFNSVKKFCTPKEQETIDTLLSIFSLLENYESFIS